MGLCVLFMGLVPSKKIYLIAKFDMTDRHMRGTFGRGKKSLIENQIYSKKILRGQMFILRFLKLTICKLKAYVK